MTAADEPSPIPDTYRRVTPSLVVRGAAKALDFYAQVFGAAERMRTPGPGGTIAHAEIQIETASSLTRSGTAGPWPRTWRT